MSAGVDEGRRPRKFVQICASRNDLFALDEDGNVHQYNFTARAWEELVASRAHDGIEHHEGGRRR